MPRQEGESRTFLNGNTCQMCRDQRLIYSFQCNGKRPSCQSCLAKGLRCVYDTACEDTTKMQSLQSQLADTEEELSSKTADLESCMALVRRFQQVKDREAVDLLARFRAGQNIGEPSATQRPPEGHSLPLSATAEPESNLPLTPESLRETSDIHTAYPRNTGSRQAPPVRFTTQPEGKFLGRTSASSYPKRRQISFAGVLGLTREPSITQICPFRSHFSIMQWDSIITTQFDACLRAGISALGPAHRLKSARLLSTPAVDITTDGLLYQVSGLLAITSSNRRKRHFQTWPMLNWTRYNVLGALRTALSESNGRGGILAWIVAVLTGWEQMHGDPAAFQIHLSALQEMTIEHSGKSSSKFTTSLVRAPSIPAAERLPDGFAHMHVLGLLPNALLDLIARLTPMRLHEQEHVDEWRRVSILLVALQPTSKPAVNALINGELGVQVTECVRISAMVFITLVLAVTDNDHWNQPMLSAIEPTYSDTHPIVTEDLAGSVYDEILLWSLCVFYALAGRLIERQLTCFRRLLRSFMIPTEATSWQILQRLMKRFLYHPSFDKRLQDIMEIEERKARPG
ncbi:hypothetical protein D0863_06819 [Hortaea werneckii]|uniref:Zn(2)-C6 fungal-type domain-containing protein n=1 Tax=Hortaea werneckii TaxID=91943 RepID=A0A3M7DXR1_HORWE|nr:hypothetical protein D0863_06819 [Hortaea werneckii]